MHLLKLWIWYAYASWCCFEYRFEPAQRSFYFLKMCSSFLWDKCYPLLLLIIFAVPCIVPNITNKKNYKSEKLKFSNSIHFCFEVRIWSPSTNFSFHNIPFHFKLWYWKFSLAYISFTVSHIKYFCYFKINLAGISNFWNKNLARFLSLDGRKSKTKKNCCIPCLESGKMK